MLNSKIKKIKIIYVIHIIRMFLSIYYISALIKIKKLFYSIFIYITLLGGAVVPRWSILKSSPVSVHTQYLYRAVHILTNILGDIYVAQ